MEEGELVSKRVNDYLQTEGRGTGSKGLHANSLVPRGIMTGLQVCFSKERVMIFGVNISRIVRRRRIWAREWSWTESGYWGHIFDGNRRKLFGLTHRNSGKGISASRISLFWASLGDSLAHETGTFDKREQTLSSKAILPLTVLLWIRQYYVDFRASLLAIFQVQHGTRRLQIPELQLSYCHEIQLWGSDWRKFGLAITSNNIICYWGIKRGLQKSSFQALTTHINWNSFDEIFRTVAAALLNIAVRNEANGKTRFQKF